MEIIELKARIAYLETVLAMRIFKSNRYKLDKDSEVYKQCGDCKEWYALINLHWHKNKTTADGYGRKCIYCTNRNHKRYHWQKQDKERKSN